MVRAVPKTPWHKPQMTDQAAAPRDLANAIRALAMDAVQQADSGHPGLPMGMADVATVLFTKFLKYDPTQPHWPDRDRFILSAGHGSMLLYSLLYLTGYPDMTLEDLKNFRQLGSKTAGHPEYGHASGIETTTGPLGQGLGNSVGFALAERLLATRFGTRYRRSLHLRDRRRRLPDGRRRPGSHHPGRSSRARPPDRAVRQQQHLDRRTDVAGDLRRPSQALRRRRLACPGGRRLRPGRRDARHPQGAEGHRQAVDDRLQDHHRLRRADQGRHRGRARLAARQGRDRGRPPESRLALPALRHSRADLHRLAQGRRQGQVGATQVGQAACRDGRGRSRRVRSPPERRHPGVGRRRRSRPSRRRWRPTSRRGRRASQARKCSR